MAFEQGFQQPGAHFESDGDLSLKQKWNSISGADTASENANGCFDCNICLDSAHEPVVTLCGHLYCWPCIYKWLHVQSSSPDSDQEQPKCPVCKADISRSTVVPLYGRGSSLSDSEGKKPHLGMVIPRRPPPSGLNALITSTATSTLHPSQQLLHPNFFQSPTQSFHHQQYFPHPYGGYPATAPSTVGGIAATSVFNPTVMFGEMFLARMFGSSDTSMFTHPYPTSYPPTATGSPRMRRQEMQLDKSLNRVSIFLFCCFILCLLLF